MRSFGLFHYKDRNHDGRRRATTKISLGEKKEHEKRSLDSSAACGLHIQMSVLYWVSIHKSRYDYVVFIFLILKYLEIMMENRPYFSANGTVNGLLYDK